MLFWMLALTATLLFGVLLGGGCRGAAYQVNVRTGAALPLADGEALVALPSGMVESLVSDGIARSGLPISGVDVRYGADGLVIAGKADVDLAFASIGVPFSTRAVPVFDQQQGLQVRLSDTRAVGGRLPNFIQEAIEGIVNRSIREGIQLQGYAVSRIELSDGALLVYVKPAAPPAQ